MNSIVRNNFKQLSVLFQSHQVEKAYIFGSVLSNKLTVNSDLAFLIRFKPGLAPLQKGDLWWSLHDSLRELFNREIDLLTEDSLKNPYLIAEIHNKRKLIYGQPD